MRSRPQKKEYPMLEKIMTIIFVTIVIMWGLGLLKALVTALHTILNTFVFWA